MMGGNGPHSAGDDELAMFEVPSGPVLLPSPAEIAATQTPAGGWARATLTQWGVPWPPPKGWRQDLERRWREANAG